MVDSLPGWRIPVALQDLWPGDTGQSLAKSADPARGPAYPTLMLTILHPSQGSPAKFDGCARQSLGAEEDDSMSS